MQTISFTQAHARTRTHTHAHTRTRTHTHTQTHMHTHTRAHAHTRAHVRTRAHTHAHARTHTHTHIHICMTTLYITVCIFLHWNGATAYIVLCIFNHTPTSCLVVLLIEKLLQQSLGCGFSCQSHGDEQGHRKPSSVSSTHWPFVFLSVLKMFHVG